MTPSRTFADIVEQLRAGSPAARLAVAAAEDATVIEATGRARVEAIADATLFGNRAEILEIAARHGLTVPSDRVVHAEDHAEAARLAVAAVSNGESDLLMKGLLHTDILLRAVLDKAAGLRTNRLMSHVFLMQADALDRLLFVSDAAMIIDPDLEKKTLILENAVEVALAFGIERPKVAILCAVETVKSSMPSTLDAACLSKMGERGQFRCPCDVDGPLAFDVAISEDAASHKGLQTSVAGRADVLVLPNLVTGNVLWKSFVYLAQGKVAGLIAGARVPIVVTSRSDSAEVKFHSIAAAAHVARHGSR